MVYIGEVLDVQDVNGGDRIKVRLLPTDKRKNYGEIAYAFPALPKVLHIKPKVGEAVLVICSNDLNKNSQRWYIGPLIAQIQDLFYSDYDLQATSLIKGGIGKPKPNIENDKNAKGAIAKNDETAIYSRLNSDIILSNNDIRIRCGSRLLTPNSGIEFNKNNPAFIKLKYHTDALSNEVQPNSESHSTATIVADEINLLSNKSKDPLFGNNELYNTDEQISDEDMQKIINQAHELPYGDVLVDFLMAFLQMFKAHTHKYPNDVPCPDEYSRAMDEKWGRCGRKIENTDQLQRINGGTPIEIVNNTFRGLYDKLLSKNVRIN